MQRIAPLRRPGFITAAVGAIVLAIGIAGSADAAPSGSEALPSNFTDTLVASVASPTAFTFTPDKRLLVTSQFGQVVVIANDAVVSDAAVDLSA
jgi:hypothetical protein